MITVACVYWKGKFRGREDIYTADWVAKLKNMVARNLDVEHRFVCLSNVDVPCERIPLLHDYPGFWSKIELFRPGLFDDRVLYLDLDLVVVRDLLPIVNYSSAFAIIKAGIPMTYLKEGKKIIPLYNSSVMAFDAGTFDSLYTKFTEEQITRLWGDQDYIAQELPRLDTFPVPWIRKIRDLPELRPGPETKVVLCMPGYKSKKNTTVAENHKWVKEIWQ